MKMSTVNGFRDWSLITGRGGGGGGGGYKMGKTWV